MNLDRMQRRDQHQWSWGSAPDPGIYRIRANLGDRRERGDSSPPQSPILAPGTALGSVPTVALSSAQAASIVADNMVI